jgi:GNAT superfamily N-acetyltransferase
MEGARPAATDDVSTLARLARGAVAELTPTRGAEHVVLLGTIDDTPVGYAVAHVEVLRDEGRLAIVDDIYVEPDARGVSVGEAMMDQLLVWASDQRCFGIDSFVLPGHREAKNFFERFGLTARAIRVHRSLGDGA